MSALAAKRVNRESLDYQRGFECGIIIACSIIQAAHDSPVLVSEALGATGLDTRKKAKAVGADDYDLKILRPVFEELKIRRNSAIRRDRRNR